MIRRLAALFALLPLAAAAQTPEQVAHETVQAYRKGYAAAVLAQESACWRSARRETVPACVQRMLAGGMLDLAMQQVERRGPNADLTPAAQRARYLAQAKRLGLSEPEAQRVMEETTGAALPAIVKGMVEAGVPIY